MENLPHSIQFNLRFNAKQFASTVMMHSEELCELINKSVEQYCESTEIGKFINEEVERQVNKAVQDSMESFFKFGKGQSVIKELTIKALENALIPEINKLKGE